MNKYMETTSIKIKEIIENNECCGLMMDIGLNDLILLCSADYEVEFRYVKLLDRVIVSRVKFNNKRNGCFTKCMKVLQDNAKEYDVHKIIVQSVETAEMARWCNKNGYKLNGISILDGIKIGNSKYCFGDYELSIN